MSEEEIKIDADKVTDDNPSDQPIDDNHNDQSDDAISGLESEPDNITLEDQTDNDNVGGQADDAFETENQPETNNSYQDDIEELTLTNIDIPNTELDEPDNSADGKRKWIFISAGIVLIGAIGGFGAFYYGNPNFLSKGDRNKEVALSLKIPSQSKLKKGRKRIISSSKKLLKSKPSSTPPESTNKIKNQSDIKTTKEPRLDPKLKKLKTPAPNNKSSNAVKLSNPKINKEIKKQGGGKIQTNSGAKILADGSLNLPSVTAAAYKGIPMVKDPRPLADADKSLGEALGGGIIPKISTDGRRPWKFYGKSFNNQNNLPQIGIIIKDLGLSRAATTAAINHTPSEVTLAFNPYAKGVANWVGLARAVGHETLITLPMEPLDFPASDPGPFALQVDLQQTENIDRLRYVLSVSTGNVGLFQMMGKRFVSSPKALEPVLQEIHSRGLLMVDDGLTRKSQIVKIASKIGLPRAKSDLFIDLDASRSNIIAKLSRLETIAKKNKSALGIAQPLPNSISIIMNWARTSDKKNLILAPVSAIVKIADISNLETKAPKTGKSDN